VKKEEGGGKSDRVLQTFLLTLLLTLLLALLNWHSNEIPERKAEQSYRRESAFVLQFEAKNSRI